MKKYSNVFYKQINKSKKLQYVNFQTRIFNINY